MKDVRVFPHNSRNIPARIVNFTIGLFITLGGLSLLYLNYFLKLNFEPPLWHERVTVLESRSSPASHEQLAKQLWIYGHQGQAQTELQFAGTFQVLGESTISQLPQSWLADVTKRRENIELLKNELKSKPNYRDGLLQLSQLYYLNEEYTEAKIYAERALKNDPQSGVAKEILAAIDKISTSQ